MDYEKIVEIVNRHVDAMLAEMQDKLGVTTGDVAGQFFTGAHDLDEIKSAMIQTMNEYARHEVLYSEGAVRT